jgi:hypothetical protein
MNHIRIEFLKVAKNHFVGLEEKQIPTEFQVSGLHLDEFRDAKIPVGSVFEELRSLAARTQPLDNFKAYRFFVLEKVGLDQEDCHKIGCSSHGSFMTSFQVAERIENRIRELS